MSLTTHRAGCPMRRTGRCLCDYIAQWDRHRNDAGVEDYTAPTFRSQPNLTPRGDVIGNLDRPSDAPFPMEERDYYPIIDKDIKALTVNGHIWEPRALRLGNEASLVFWKGQAKHWERGYWIMAGLSFAGWGLAVARGIWGF